MSANKLLNEFGLLALIEASYNAGGSPTVADGLLVTETPYPEPAYSYDGARGNSPGGGSLGRVKPRGRSGTASLSCEAIGYAAAYSAGNTPSVHVPLRFSGMDAAVDTTPASEKWTYTPAASSFDSGMLRFYSRGEQIDMTGVYANLTIEADGPTIPIFTFECMGVVGFPTDAGVLASIVYNTNQPPVADAIALTIGSFTAAIVRSFRFTTGRNIGARLNDNVAGGHAGFSMGRRLPTFECVIEHPTLTTTPYHAAGAADFDRLRDEATELTIDLTVGNTQYNRWKLDINQAQVSDVSYDEDGPTALVGISFTLAESAPGAGDEYSIIFD